ncbi:MAG: hypothetical protein HOM68_09010 [Gemmatimonadetes bacterium]|nr:hypothetical protein [Gemmatimonadota bacterium]
MAEEKLYSYEVTCAGGFEDVLIDEIRERLGKRVVGLREERGEVGRVFFDYEGSPRKLLELECATGICSVVRQMHDVTVGPAGLERIRQRLTSLPLDSMRRLAGVAGELHEATGYRLRVHQRGAHRFTASDVEAAARQVLETQELSASPGGLDLELRLQKRRAHLKLALRNNPRAGAIETEGLPAAYVAAIVRMLGLDDSDDLLLIQAQAQAAIAAARVSGSQIVATSRRRSQGNRAPFVVCADDQLPIGSATMTAAIIIVGDDHDTVPGSGQVRLQQVVECVAEDGVIAALVPRSDSFAARLPQWGLPLEVIGAVPLYIRRQRWALFLLQRLPLLHLG